MLNTKQKNCYQFSGGTAILHNADMKSEQYLIPGNYYCGSNDIAMTLKSCPFNMAFLLKVELAVGGNELYIRQTFIRYDTNEIISRTYFRDELSWRGEAHYLIGYIEAGTAYLGNCATNSVTTKHVRFKTSFPAAPAVVATLDLNTNIPANSDIVVTVSGITVDGFDIRYINNTDTVISNGVVHWLATGK